MSEVKSVLIVGVAAREHCLPAGCWATLWWLRATT